jgi:glycosyltransferase involved in cell wall biosynthesis
MTAAAIAVNEPSLPASQARLAIVVTCYNYEDYVGRCIASIQAQTSPDFELLVVDDGSTDASWQVIQATGVPASRIANGGQRVACLHGLSLTSAPFVLFLDADDELVPAAVETILRHLDHEVAKLQFPLQRVDADGRATGQGPVAALGAFRLRGELRRRILATAVHATPPTSGNVFRRDLCALLEEAVYDRAVDGVILFAAPFLGDVVALPESLGRYRIHGRNDSGLGKALDPATMRRDLDRFAARTRHLADVVARLDPEARLVDPDATFYARERRLCLDVLDGRRPSPARLAGLWQALWRDYLPIRHKVALSLVYLAATVLPPARAGRLLAYRFGLRGGGGVTRR